MSWLPPSDARRFPEELKQLLVGGMGLLGKSPGTRWDPTTPLLGCREDAQPACPLLELLGLLAAQGRVTAGTAAGTRGDTRRAWRHREPGGSGGAQGCWGAAVSEVWGLGGVSCPVGPTSAHPEEPSPLPVVSQPGQGFGDPGVSCLRCSSPCQASPCSASVSFP